MFEIGTILAIARIVITSYPNRQSSGLQLRKEKRRRKRWSADLQIDEAQIRELKHYAYECWQQEIAVDAEGNADHRVEARIVNIGDKLLERLTFSVYSDAKNLPESEV